MTASKKFLFLCLSFIFGIALNSFFHITWPVLLALLIFGLVLSSFWLLYSRVAFLGFCLIFITIGMWHYQNYEFKHSARALSRLADRGETLTLIGKVVKDPDIRETSVKLTIGVLKLKISEKGSYPLEGKVLVTTRRYPQYEYGDKLKIRGQLKVPPVFDDFNYQDYLAKQGIYAVMDWPEIELLTRRDYGNLGSLFFAKILEFKNNLRRVLYQNLSPPQSSLLGAIILGDKQKMAENLKEKLNIAGVRHITAISGMHITILGLILLELFLGLGLWRSHALYLSLAFLILFIVMVGAPPSAIRAGLMAGFLMVAQSFGRLSRSDRAIIFAGAVILGFNPLLLKSDVGFQLSFLATLGIIYFLPFFQRWLKKVPEKVLGFGALRSIIAMTFSAQIFTLPLLIYNFGRASLLSPLSNILIVPLLPFLLGFGLCFVLAGLFWPFLGWLLSWPVWLLLSYILAVINFLSRGAWSAVYLAIPWYWLLISYIFLGGWAWFLKRKKKPEFLRP